MRRASAIDKEVTEISTVKDLTGVFESIASTQIAKVKQKVEFAKDFFELLWQRYSSIRIDPNSRITNRGRDDGRKVFVMISGESGLSGDIDDRLVETVLHDYDAVSTDIIVLGSHGANQLKQRGISYIRFFQVPPSEGYIDVSPVIKAIVDYSNIVIYYEEYISLGVQEIKKIDLIASIQDLGDQGDNDDVMTTADTIFEPSLQEIAEQMEVTMITLAFSQVIFESSLAQDASRFNAMAQAKKRAYELINLRQLEFHRAKRGESDRRLREVMVSIKKKKRAKARR